LDGEPRLDYPLEIRQFLQTAEPSDATSPESQPTPEPAQPATSQEDGFLSPSVPPGYKPGPT